METLEKAKILSSATHYDSCGPKMCEVNVNQGLGGIYHAKAEHHSCRIFKTLMDNNCSFDCRYCANSNRCAKKKAIYGPQELANLFNYLHENVGVNGLFLSSAVAGNPDKVTEDMIDAVKIIREKQGFKGYVHFKVLPGTSYELIKQASELSNRMSVNIEAPNKDVLSEFSGCKDFHHDLLKRQAWVSRMKLDSGQTTQMIVSKDATDKDVLKMSNWEYDKLDMKRVYYSAFHPVKGTPMENEKPQSEKREKRLYNADFLMRSYDYNLREFYRIMDNGMLPDEDPKLALAKLNFESPVDINEATYEELIKVPGIGPKTANKILDKKEKIKSYGQLDMLGASIERAKPFIEVCGKRQSSLMEF